MEQFLGDAKRLVHRLQSHDNSVDILIGQTTNLQNKLIAMRQYHEEVNKLNERADHRPRSTLILGSQLENQRIQNLELENRELSISLAEHQSALELIMNKYREQVLVMMKLDSADLVVNKPNGHVSSNEVAMKEKIAEMANVMRQSALIDETIAAREIEVLRCLQLENENLRELLEISGKKAPKCAYDFDKLYKHFSESLVADNATNHNGDIRNMESVSIEKDTGNNDKNMLNDATSSLEHIRAPRTNNFDVKPKYYDSLEKLFSKPDSGNMNGEEEGESNAESPIVQNLNSSENYFISTDPSENCFRAIITDIKPLEQGFDVNKDVIHFEADHTEHVNPFNVDKDNNELHEPPRNKPDIPDDISLVSEAHDTRFNDVVKEHFQPESTGEETETSDPNSNIIDEFEEELMRNFVSVIEAADHENKGGKDIGGEHPSEEDAVIGMLDDMLDLDDGDEVDTDDEDKSDDDEDEFVDEVMENISSDEEDANDEFNFHGTVPEEDEETVDKNQVLHDNNLHTDEEDNDNLHQNLDNGSVNSNTTLIDNPDSNDDVDFGNLHKPKTNLVKDLDKQSHMSKGVNYKEQSLSNGEISDTDSEVTITSDDVDVDEALAGFDSIIDDLDDTDGELD